MTQLAPTQGATTQGQPGVGGAAVDPVFQHEYPNPRTRDHAIILRTWTQSPPLLSIFALPPNGTNYDWPVPRGREHPFFLRGFILPSLLRFIPPALNYDFPNPLSRPFPTSLRFWSQTPNPSFIPIPGALICTNITAYWIIEGNPDLENAVKADPDAGAAVLGHPDTEVCD